jgi:spermidine synthase
VELNKGYPKLIAQRDEVRSLLSNPKIKLIVDDGRRWLAANRGNKYDFIVQNTTWHFRANITNLLSQEYMKLVGEHLKPDGVYFFNTTGSARAQRTACMTFPHAFRFSNHMAVSKVEFDVNFDRWRQVLLAYKIDGKPVFDSTQVSHQAELAAMIGYKEQWRNAQGGPVIEPCTVIKKRTNGVALLTDDNMGSEWRYLYKLQ